MNRHFVQLLIVLWLVAASATADSKIIDLYYTTSLDGIEYVYRVPSEKLDATSNWSPESEPPPISIARAIALARSQLANTTDDQTLLLGGIRLTPTQGRTGTSWYYTVSFHLQTEYYTSFDSLDVVVLLDGSVVERELRHPQD